MRTKLLSRLFPSFLTFLFMAIITIGFCWNAHAAEKRKLIVQTWGGAKQVAEKHAFCDPFSEETGIEVIQVVAAADVWGKVAAQVRSNNIEWDIITGYDYPSCKAAAEKGLLEEIDYSVVTRAKEMIQGAQKKYGVGQEVNSIVLGYNTKKWPGKDHPKSWADFFDVKKYPGPRTTVRSGFHVYNIFAALLADGVPPDQLVPIDYDRAFKKLDQVKPHIKVWYDSGSRLVQILMDEEVDMGLVFDGRTKVAKDMGAPYDFAWDQGMFLLCYWNVIKGAPHKKEAMEFLNFISRPEQQAIYTNYCNYSSANPKSIRYIHPNMQKDFAIYPDNLKKQINILSDKTSAWLTENNDEINEKWNIWLAR